MPVGLLALTAMAGSALLLVASWWLVTANSTVVIVIRHAEKVEGGGADPPLSEAGEARAALLARMFGDASKPGHIDAIYVTPSLRNRMTAAPLAARLGLTPTVTPSDDPRGLARRVLRDHRGARILIVGHRDTIPALAAALSGAADLPAMAADEYGTMYIVTAPRVGRANVLRVNY